MEVGGEGEEKKKKLKWKGEGRRYLYVGNGSWSGAPVNFAEPRPVAKAGVGLPVRVNSE